MLDEKTTLGLIGAGNMAEALVRGLLSAKAIAPAQIIAADPSEARRRLFEKDLGVGVSASNAPVARRASLLLLAVKPALVARVGGEVGELGPAGQIVVSIAAGVPLEVLSRHWKGRALARVMPNTPALVGAGASAVCFQDASDVARAQVLDILRAAGPVALEVETEALLDAVTGLSGSGPAYVFELIEALSDGGAGMGLARADALALAAATVEGAARMVRLGGEPPALLKDRVSSPGGTTLAGLAVLEKRGFRQALIEAVTAATGRSRQLAQEVKKE